MRSDPHPARGRVLVTGGAGYIGSTLVPLLLFEGRPVRVLDSLMYGGDPLLPVWSHPQFEFQFGDIRDRKTVTGALEDVEAVVHLAAIVGDPACSRSIQSARAVNLDASLQLFDLAWQAGVRRFVFASTCSNYGRMLAPTTYVTELTELCPVSLYAETKVAVEKALLEDLRDGGMAVTVLRFATVFGVSSRMRFDLTVNEFSMELLTKRKLTIYGEQFWRPYIHVRDVARAVGTVLTSPMELVDRQVFNVGDTSQNYQKGRLVALICAQLDGATTIERVTAQEDPRDYRVSFSKIATQLGFSITRTVEDGIREVIAAIKHGVITDVDHPRYRN